jgi:hypothetical protein
MRSPLRLLAEIGPASFMTVQALFAGMVLSALSYPLMVCALLWSIRNLFTNGVPGPIEAAVLSLDLFSIVAGHAVFLLLGWRTLKPARRRGFWKVALFTPVYWTAMSLAAFRALVQLVRMPHHWDKTPHFPTVPTGAQACPKG